MKQLALLAQLIAVCCSVARATAAPTINIVDDPTNRWVDVFYTPSSGGREFLSWELVVKPDAGGLLDPVASQRRFDALHNAPAADTWMNTVLSSISNSPANYLFNAYHPGMAFPPIPQSPLPTAGGNPDRLEWIAFDALTGDGASAGSTPYHMARVLYTEGGRGIIQGKFFETLPAPLDFTSFPFNDCYGSGCTVADPLVVVQDSTADALPGRLFYHQFTAADGLSANFDWTILSFTGPTTPTGYSVHPTSGFFTWNSAALEWGAEYTLVVSAQNQFGLSDTGTLTITILPEPGAVVLTGLGLIGMTASRRRLS